VLLAPGVNKTATVLLLETLNPVHVSDQSAIASSAFCTDLISTGLSSDLL
jgi:hypothetical protein